MNTFDYSTSSLTTEMVSRTTPCSNLKSSSDGVVETESLIGAAISNLTGVIAITDTISSLNFPPSTTKNSTLLPGVSWVSNTEMCVGVTLPKRAPATISSLGHTTTTLVILTTTDYLGTHTLPTSTTSGVLATSTNSTGTSVVFATDNPSSSTAASASPSRSTPRSMPSNSESPESTSPAPTTIMTATTTVSPVSSPTTSPVSTIPIPDHVSSLRWVAIPVTLGILIIIALLFLWRKSFDKIGCFFHAVSKTIRGALFGEQWKNRNVTRSADRRKERMPQNQVRGFSDQHIQDYLLQRRNEKAQDHGRQVRTQRQNSPSITALSDGTGQQAYRGTSTPRPDAVRMTNLRVRPELASQGRPTYALSGESRTDVPSIEVVPSLHVNGQAHFNKMATWPEPPHPGVPWRPQTSDSFDSHNQWFPHETSIPELKDQMHEGVKARRQSLLNEIDAHKVEAKRQSNPSTTGVQSRASFRGARGVWPDNHPRLVPSLAHILPPPAAVVALSDARRPLTLPHNHPILRIPTPRPLPGELKRSFTKLNVPLSRIRRGNASQWMETTTSETSDAHLIKQGPIQKPDKGRIASFQGWTKQKDSSTNHDIEMEADVISPRLEGATQMPEPSLLAILPHECSFSPPSRGASISQWTDATVPRTPFIPSTADSHAKISETWQNLLAGKGLGPSSHKYSGTSASSWEESILATDCDLSPKFTGPHLATPKVAGRDIAGAASFYSGYWSDDCGGKIEYDHTGRIKDVEFQDHTVVALDETPTVSEVPTRSVSQADLEKGNKSQVDLHNHGYQRDRRGNWI